MARLSDSCRKAKRIGFQNVELDWERVCREFSDKTRRVTKVKTILLENDLNVAGVCAGNITAERADQLQLQTGDLVNAMESIKEIGGPLATVTGGHRTLENFNQLREGVGGNLAHEAERIEIDLALANQINTRIENRQDLLAFFTSPFSQRIGVCVDVYNFQLAAVNSGDVIREMAKRVKLVRMSDMMGTIPVAFGQGEIEIKGLIRALRKVGYDGTIVIDHLSGRDDEVEKTLEHAYRYMQGIIS